jgi:hypothetical protein
MTPRQPESRLASQLATSSTLGKDWSRPAFAVAQVSKAGALV